MDYPDFLQPPPSRFSDKVAAQDWWFRASHCWQDVRRAHFWLLGAGSRWDRKGVPGWIDERERRDCDRMLFQNGWTLQAVSEAHEWAVRSNFNLNDHRPPSGYGFKKAKSVLDGENWSNPPPVVARCFSEPEPADDARAKEWLTFIGRTLSGTKGDLIKPSPRKAVAEVIYDGREDDFEII